MTTKGLTLAALLLSSAAAVAQEDETRPSEMDAAQIARELGVSDDDRRPEDQTRINLLGRELIIGGQAELASGIERGYELSPDADDGKLTLDPEIKIETIWLIEDDLVTFTEIKAFGEGELWKDGGGTENRGGVELGEAWLLKTRIGGTPLALQVGRQQLQDRREWWWDEDLDMVRLHYFGDRVTAFAGIGRELGYYSTVGRRDPEDRDIVRKVGSIKWDWMDRQEIQLLVLDQRDNSTVYGRDQIVADRSLDEADVDATWMGVRVRGRVKTDFPGKFYYWGDLARVRGHETLFNARETPTGDQQVVAVERQRVSGWAYDLGASFELPVQPEAYLTVSHARGSGGASPFRQTGLQGNNGKFRGNSRFRYYGEVLRPELSNLSVLTGALGIEPLEDGWIETVWHRYRQITALPEIAGSRLDVEPEGNSKRLGQEIDLVASYRPKSGWDFELTGGVFEAGPAFGELEGERAWTAEIKVSKNF